MEISLGPDSNVDRYQFLVRAVVPRPIAWVSTVSAAGVRNLAPFSYFGVACSEPPLLSLGVARSGGKLKDTARNLLETREAVIHLVPEHLAHLMLATAESLPADVNEFETAGLEPLPARTVAPQRIALAPLALECRLERHLELGAGPTDFFLLEAVAAYVDDAVLTDGMPDAAKLQIVARLGGAQYSRVIPIDLA